MKTVITTVGTSLLTNRDDRPWAGWRSGNPFPEQDKITHWLIQADPRRISAETHTWYRLGILDSPDKVQVILVHSQTLDGKFCAEQLQKYAEIRHLQADVRQIDGLTYADAITFNKGLVRLVRVLAEIIHANQKRGEVLLAATGGFKAEIAIANLVGILLQVPVYYIYEQFEQLIEIEPIPVTLKPDWLKESEREALLKKFTQNDMLERSKIDSFLKKDGKLELLLESVEIDGVEMVSLNLLGELAARVLQAPSIDWPEACNILPHEKIKLQDIAHHRPKSWEKVVDLLARSGFVRLIRYEARAGDKKGIYEVPNQETDLFVVINDGTYVLGLQIETTARNADQRRLVLNHLRQQVSSYL